MIRDDKSAHPSIGTTSQMDALAFQLGSRLYIGSQQKLKGSTIRASSTYQHKGNVYINAPRVHIRLTNT